MLRSDINAEVERLMGTPYHHQGRSPHGVDCIGLVALVATRLGYPYEDCRDYSAEWHIHGGGDLLRERCDRYMDEIPMDSVLPGDVYLFRFGRAKVCSHIGFATEDAGVVHAYREVGKVISHRLDAKWTARIKHCYRFRGVE